MVVPNVSMNLTGYYNMSISTLSNYSLVDYIDIIKPLVIFVIGITIYSLFIFKFYRFLARKEVIKFKFGNTEGFIGIFKRIAEFFWYIINNIFLIPIFVFLWMMILVILLLLLSKNYHIQNILLTSAALVASVRVCAYYDEALSQDLAKMIPFALLGVFIVDSGFFSLDNSIKIARDIPQLWSLLLFFLIFIIVLELFLSIISGLVKVIGGSDELKKKKD